MCWAPWIELHSFQFFLKYSVKGFWNLFSFGIQNPANFCCGILNPGLWNLEYSRTNAEWNLESGIPLTIGIQNPSSSDKESGIQHLESRIHSVESRIQDCLGLPYVVQTEPLKSYSHDCPLQCL